MAIDSYRYLDFASRQIIKAWVGRESQHKRDIPWTPLAKPLSECTIALLSTAGVALNSDAPFDQEGERRNPWWGDPTFRIIPLGSCESEVKLYHLHIDTRFGEEDLDVVLPMRRLTELATEGFIGKPADSHYSIMGYQLKPEALIGETGPAIAKHMKGEGVDAAVLVPA